MTKNSLAFICRAFTLPFIFVLIQQWRVFLIFFHIDTGFGFTIFTLIAIAGFTLLNLTTILGLALVKQWGFILSYLTLPVSTLFFGANYIPFVSNPLGIIITNSILLICIIYLHVRWKKKRLR